MDAVSLAATVLASRNQVAAQDAQVSVLKKAMQAEGSAAMKLLDSMSLPLATEGSLGTRVNTYA